MKMKKTPKKEKVQLTNCSNYSIKIWKKKKILKKEALNLKIKARKILKN